MADSWFGTTALPAYGCYIPTEERLKLFPDLRGKRVLDVGCGSGHSLKWCGDRGAAELWGLEMQLLSRSPVLFSCSSLPVDGAILPITGLDAPVSFFTAPPAVPR